MTRAREGEGLSPSQVFDCGCAKTRVQELTELLIGEYALEDMRKLADKQKRAFEAVTPYPYVDQIRERFFERARQEALRILEVERKNVADFHTPALKRYLETYMKQLRFVLDDRKPFPVYQEESWNLTLQAKTVTAYSKHEIINRFSHLLQGFVDFRPYLNEELTAMWKEADMLASQETFVVQEGLKTIEKTSKTQETTESQETKTSTA